MWWRTHRNGRVHLNRRGRQFIRLQAAEVCASAVVMLDTPCSEVVWRVLDTHIIPQFSFHFPSLCHRVPSHFNWTLPSLSVCTHEFHNTFTSSVSYTGFCVCVVMCVLVRARAFSYCFVVYSCTHLLMWITSVIIISIIVKTLGTRIAL
jgi:hypothetical protein